MSTTAAHPRSELVRPELIFPPFFLPFWTALAIAGFPLLILGYAIDGIWSNGLADWLSGRADFEGVLLIAMLGAGIVVAAALLIRSTFLFSAGCATFLSGFIVFSFNDSLGGGIVVSIVFVPITALFVITAITNFGQFLRSRPLLLLEAEGLECALGRISWGDVTEIGVVGYERESRRIALDEWLYLSLQPGAVLERVSEDYFKGISWGYYEEKGPRRDVGGRVELPLWKKRASVLATVRRFYGGAIADRAEVRDKRRLDQGRTDVRQ